MPALQIRSDVPPEELRRLAKQETNARAARRLLALANALDGMSRAQAARLAGMDRQTLRDWVIRYNEVGVKGLADDWGEGRPCRLDEGQQAVLKAIVLKGPDREKDGISAWRVRDLCRIVEGRFGVRYAESGLTRLLHALDLSWQTPRPRHPQVDVTAQEAFKKSSGRCRIGLPPSTRKRSALKSGFRTKPESGRKAA